MSTVAWASLAHRRVYFGHQSVGQNIIDGMRELCAQSDLAIRWVEGDRPELFDRPVFCHTRLGRNRDPLSKIDAFAATMRNGIGHRAQIAFFKLCYVDITAATEVDALFGYYARVMAALKSEYPQTVFAHVTAPLTVVPPRWRRWFARFRGRAGGAIADNAARARFNGAMRTAYVGREPLFDLADWEANGSPVSCRKAHDWALDPCLSPDGGHLSPRGQAVIGRALLDFLAGLRVP